jgi:hypothetical protein
LSRRQETLGMVEKNRDTVDTFGKKNIHILELPDWIRLNDSGRIWEEIGSHIECKKREQWLDCDF